MPEGQLTIEDFIPVVGKNYIAPHLVSIETGAYKEFKYSRAVLMIPKTPTTSGTVYIYPGAFPVNDLSSIPVPAGSLVYLDARGAWYVKTSSAGTEQFLVIDAGAAANAQAIAALLGAGSTPASTPAQVVWGTPVSQTINASDSAVAAANSSRRALALFNASTAGQRIAVTAQDPATAVIGFCVLDAGQGYIFNPPDGVTKQKLRGWASAASGTLIVCEGT